MEETIQYYEDARQDHTRETLTVAMEHARQTSIHTVVLASTTGATALAALQIFQDADMIGSRTAPI